MLGIFDSGLGGLTVVRRVRALLPHEDIVYFADQAHVPYGDRDDADLARLLAQNVAYLEGAGVDAVVMGCNTSCAVAARRGWPAAGVPILDLIAAAAGAVAASGVRSVGVLATAATARSGAYGEAIRALVPDARVREVGAPKLVPLVESGVLAGPLVDAAVAEVLARFDAPPEVLVLACTHYPLLDAAFAAALGPEVVRLDPAVAQADAAVRFTRERDSAAGSGATHYVTTGDADAYARALERVVGPLGPADTVRHTPQGTAAASRSRLSGAISGGRAARSI